MGKKAFFTDAEQAEAERLTREATDVCRLKDGLSVVLSVRLNLTNKQVAEILQSSPATVVRMHNKVRNSANTQESESDTSTSSWGGRRNAYMSHDEEAEFLRPWEEPAIAGGMLVVSPIHSAFEARVGKKVPPATVYRLLARHGWRKIAPDNIHPKGSLEAQDEFKKKGSQTHWMKP